MPRMGLARDNAGGRDRLGDCALVVQVRQHHRMIDCVVTLHVPLRGTIISRLYPGLCSQARLPGATGSTPSGGQSTHINILIPIENAQSPDQPAEAAEAGGKQKQKPAKHLSTQRYAANDTERSWELSSGIVLSSHYSRLRKAARQSMDRHSR